MGHTHLNKLLAGYNMPEFNWQIYKRHEEEVGPVVEEMARQSCKKAALEEKQLTLKNIEKVKKLL